MKVNEVAWSNYFNSYIACVDYKTNKNWKFALCRRDGKVSWWNRITAKQARTLHSNYKWVYTRGE